MSDPHIGLPPKSDGLSSPGSLPASGDIGRGGGGGKHPFLFAGRGCGISSATNEAMWKQLSNALAANNASPSVPAPPVQSVGTQGPMPTAADLNSKRSISARRWWLIALAIGVALIAIWYSINNG